MKSIIKKLAAAASAAAVMLLSVFFVACSGPADGAEDDFLPGYDMSNVSVREDPSIDPKYVGDAIFMGKVMTDGENSMGYRIYEPDHAEGEKLPVLLFFHGSGERGKDNTRQISYEGLANMLTGDSVLLKAIVIAPQCTVADGYWVDGGGVPYTGTYSTAVQPETPVLTKALKILKYYVKAGDVNADQIYLMGISMGGYATWDVLARHHEIIAAAVPICGGCDLDKAEELVDMPIYAFHGLLDSLVPPIGTQSMVEKLKELGSTSVIYVEYAEGNHDIWNDAMSTEGLADWLLSKKTSDRG